MAQSHESWWFKRSGTVNIILLVGILAVMALWPFGVPAWAVVGLLVVVLLMGICLTSERMRLERRLIRSIWQGVPAGDPMAIPLTTWTLVAGVVAAGITLLAPRALDPLPPTVVWLSAWAVLMTVQAAWWALRRKRA